MMADTFIWYELMTSDRDAALRFYTEVVGWTAQNMIIPEMDDYRYTILSAGDHGIGGLAELDEAMRDAGGKPGWFGYIGVADTDAMAQAIVAAGGEVRQGPDDIPTVGRFAMVADPGGAPFYLLTPLPREDAQPTAEPGTPGTIGWHELYAGNGEEAAFAFYTRHFGWETVELMDMGPMGKYRIVGTGGAPMGAMMNKPPQMPASNWGFYFNVEGIGAAIGRIHAGGGQVTMGPHEVPGGSWIVQATDPQGASFALVSTTR